MKNNPILYRLSQLMSLLLGARIFVLLLFTFALYVSTFFLFNQEESLRKFVFDYKVHGIIFCSVLSIAAGGIINRFYDNEKDRVARPFRTRLQSFLKEKYFLYGYITLNLISLIISALLSPRILIFFLVYQFFIWYYSHKLSKILIVNNLTYVSLSLYPFFGMLVYYQHFSLKIFLMAIYLFLLMLSIDLIKDLLTKNVDKVFGYSTLANVFQKKVTYNTIAIVLAINVVVSGVIVNNQNELNIFSWYFILSMFFYGFLLFPILTHQKNKMFWVINLLRVWVFIGVIFMLFNGLYA
ncbi:UbiA family prenyltransferase [Cloacibacterium rupense]|nr:UbiA family prenyltransferase [Cloacibacterium rupense]